MNFPGWKQSKKIAIVIIGLVSFCYSQETIESSASRLKGLRREIKALEDELKDVNRRESSELETLANLDQQVSLTRMVIQELKKEEEKQQQKIEQTRQKLNMTQSQLLRLQELFSQRMAYVYKHGKLTNLELILTSESLNQALVRWRYLQLIAQQDRRDITSIKTKKSQVEDAKKRLETELTTQQELLQEKKDEESDLNDKKKEKQQLLVTIRKDKQQLQNLITEKKQAAIQLQKIIEKLEEDRRRSLAAKEVGRKKNGKKGKGAPEKEEALNLSSKFGKNKGKLDWPVSGKMISYFGTEYNPQLKTKTYNQGIDIKSSAGTPVKAIGSGKVTTITYLRGYGNTLIIDHDDGFYSVYSHIDDIVITSGEEVDLGQVIAKVGESVDGTLHFEIYGNGKALDPEEWLRKRR